MLTHDRFFLNIYSPTSDDMAFKMCIQHFTANQENDMKDIQINNEGLKKECFFIKVV